MTIHPVDAAKHKGWAVEKWCANSEGSTVTLCRIPNPHHPFAVHYFNSEDGGFHYGDYCATLPEAVTAYNQKRQRYGV